MQSTVQKKVRWIANNNVADSIKLNCEVPFIKQNGHLLEVNQLIELQLDNSLIPNGTEGLVSKVTYAYGSSGTNCSLEIVDKDSFKQDTTAEIKEDRGSLGWLE